jgi:hypothetical protein
MQFHFFPRIPLRVRYQNELDYEGLTFALVRTT